jgi:putative inorganic carbon (hco3(-)) transporter
VLRSKIEIWLVILGSLLYIAANSYLMLSQSYLGVILPFLLLGGLWIFFAPEKLFFAIALFAPLSVPLYRVIPGLAFDFWLPTEPMLVFLLVMLILKSLKERYFRKELLNHPVFISMLFLLAWLAISTITSVSPIVSFKYFLVRFWFLGIFFYLAYIIFRQNLKNIDRFLYAYIIGLAIVIAFSILKQAGSGLFSHNAAYSSAAPFFIDHTSYGAALALIIPIITAFAFYAKQRLIKFSLWSLNLYFLAALILSYSRAAWLSLIVGVGVWVLILLKVRFRSLVIIAVLAIAVFFTFQDEIVWRLERNTTDSSGDLAEHVQSMFNISSDASNLERINRWDAAWQMFKEKPLFGWGPGTYQFEYAPFQMSYNKTIISTNFGTWGNAHSDYLGFMSEAGFPSVIAFIFIWVFALISGFRLLKAPNITQKHRYLVMACIVGLITYITHGFLNNFLDIDKIAATFWGYMAIIVALEFVYKEKKNVDERGVS